MAALFANQDATRQQHRALAALNFELALGKTYIPAFRCERHTLELIRSEALRRPGRRLQKHRAPPPRPRRYDARLESELEVIIKMGFPGYFLIVADFINWAKDHGIPVGPGRGSGAGSLVAWALGITDLDPIPYDLLFERFLNPERVSLPDFDIDFCMDRRDEVIDYVARKYGRDGSARSSSTAPCRRKRGTATPARARLPYGFVDGIAKLIPLTSGLLDEALGRSEAARRIRSSQARIDRALPQRRRSARPADLGMNSRT